MDEVVIGIPTSGRLIGNKRRYIYGKLSFKYAFDYFMDDFDQPLHNRPIDKECILVNSFASNLTTDYSPYPTWDVTHGHFSLHQTDDIQEGLCGKDDTNYAFFNTGWCEGTILVDAWFGSIGTWISVIMRELEARYTVVADGSYEWEKEIRLDIYHNQEKIWESPVTRDTNILNSFSLGMTIIDKNARISSTNEVKPVKEVFNYVLPKDFPVGIGSSKSIKDGQFTGIAGVYFFGSRYNRPVQI